METLYKTIDSIIAAQKKARQNNDFLTLVLNAEALLEYIYPLISYSVEQEAEYRKFEASLSQQKDENGKRYSGAYCEVQAKATDFYREWQKAQKVHELMIDMVNIAKVLARSVNNELKAN